uniref:Uncharacterized protein n=1 Tax=Rhizophora mucronata TaxID=61149 RepID=A0A2P2PMK5_RHIMU
MCGIFGSEGGQGGLYVFPRKSDKEKENLMSWLFKVKKKMCIRGFLGLEQLNCVHFNGWKILDLPEIYQTIRHGECVFSYNYSVSLHE